MSVISFSLNPDTPNKVLIPLFGNSRDEAISLPSAVPLKLKLTVVFTDLISSMTAVIVVDSPSVSSEVAIAVEIVISSSTSNVLEKSLVDELVNSKEFTRVSTPSKLKSSLNSTVYFISF